MIQGQVSWQLVAFAEVSDFNGLGLPDAEAGNYLAAFIDAADGQHTTALMTGESSDMIASCGLQLGDISISQSYFRAFRIGWPEDWENPADTSVWMTPKEDL